MSQPQTYAALLREVPTRIDQRPNGCWAACVATITGISLDDLDQGIPADATEEWMWEHATALHNDMTSKLRARGWRLEYVWRDIPRGYAIASGPSPRLQTVQHAVVMRDGELWHDPHPSRAGLVHVESFEVLIPILGTLGEPAATLRALAAGPQGEVGHCPRCDRTVPLGVHACRGGSARLARGTPLPYVIADEADGPQGEA